MAKTITIAVEVYDGTTTDQIENIVGDALNKMELIVPMM